jgi:hypothetical protein
LPALFDVKVSRIEGLKGGTFGNAFIIGVDINQAGNAPGSNMNVVQFEVWDTTTTTELAHMTSHTQLALFANGTGFTDALLSSVSLAGLGSGNNIEFRLQYNNASDGPDSFFLISTTGPPPPQIPEPWTMSLTGAGLVGIYFLRRRRSASL